MFAQRLIDKKKETHVSATQSPTKEMCDIAFCQLPSGEMKGLFSWLSSIKTVLHNFFFSGAAGTVLCVPVRNNENFDPKIECLLLNEPRLKETGVVLK